MKEIKIIEIPIYSVKSNDDGNVVLQAEKLYNKVNGYLLITATNEKVSLTEYKVINDTISNMHVSGFHFHIEDNMSNNEISNEIINLIEGFEKDVMSNNNSIEKGLYLNILKNLDIKKIIKEL